MPVEVSAVINLHDEGSTCVPSLRSARMATIAAGAAGIECEVLIVLDSADSQTIDAAHDEAGGWARLISVGVHDLGRARNSGVADAVGEYVAFLDGDDLWGEQWLHRSHASAVRSLSDGSPDAIWHPAVSFFFGKQPSVYHHIASTDASFSLSRFRMHNSWTALCFARRRTLLDVPYRPNHLDLGFGFEDWSWNHETLKRGISHQVVDHTCHFIHKRGGSLLGSSQSAVRTPYRFLR